MNARCHQRGQTQKVEPELCRGNKENTPLKPGTRKKRHFFFSFFNGVQVFYIKKKKTQSQLHDHKFKYKQQNQEKCTFFSPNDGDVTARQLATFTFLWSLMICGFYAILAL